MGDGVPHIRTGGDQGTTSCPRALRPGTRHPLHLLSFLDSQVLLDQAGDMTPGHLGEEWDGWLYREELGWS